MENMGLDKRTYVYGVKLNSKEDYDKLMNEYSGEGLFAINFKELFQGYPDQYPALVNYEINNTTMTFMQMSRTRALLDAGFLIQLSKI